MSHVYIHCILISIGIQREVTEADHAQKREKDLIVIAAMIEKVAGETGEEKGVGTEGTKVGLLVDTIHVTDIVHVIEAGGRRESRDEAVRKEVARRKEASIEAALRGLPGQKSTYRESKKIGYLK